MAYDERLATTLQDDLQFRPDVSERKMFGGLCFMLSGNMLCGVHSGGAMFRVGKEREAEALALPGVSPLAFTGRKMGGLVDVNDAAFDDANLRKQLLSLALSFVAALPPK